MLVLVEKCVQVQLGSYCSGQARVGLLLGRITKKKGYVLHFIPTPVVEGVSASKSGLPSEEWWIEDHAHQVWEMIPAGVSLVGLCLLSPSPDSSTTNSLTKLSDKLCHSQESRNSPFLTAHFSTVTTNFRCQCLPAPHRTSTVTPVEIIFDELKSSWCHLESKVALNVKTLVDLAAHEPFSAVKDKLVAGLNSWCSGTVVLENRYCAPDESLDSCVSGGYARCVIFPRHKPLVCGQSQPQEGTPSALTLSGTVSIMAYVPLETSLAEAAQVLTNDVVETVVVRCRTMCEDMQPKFTGTLQLPRRVELALEGSVLRFYAYLFPEETEKDMCGRVCEVLGVDAHSLTIVHSEQKSLDMKRSIAGKHLPAKRCKIATITLSVLAVIFAIIFPKLYKSYFE